MSEHHWVRNNLECYLAGGLEVEEQERLEKHAAECPPCAQALDQARSVEDRLVNMFRGERPDPALEDRMIHVLRGQPAPRRGRGMPLPLKIALGVAAVVLLGAFGAGVSAFIRGDRLSFPGMSQAKSEPGKFQLGVDLVGGTILNQRIDPNDLKNLTLGGKPHSELKTADELAKESLQKSLESLDKDGAKTKANLLTLDISKPMDFREKSNFDKAEKKEESKPKSDPKGGFGYGGGEGAKTPDPGVPAPVNQPVNESPSTYTPPPPYKGYFDPSDMFKGQAKSGEKDANKEARERKPGEEHAGEKGDKGKSDDEGEGKGGRPGKGETTLTTQEPEAKSAGRKIIRMGDMDFEIDSFDDAVVTITRLVSGTRGFIATANSEKLANGKVRGSVVIRVPPEQLDKLVLDLRKELGKKGELKGMKITSQDITKQYTDNESRLRAARAMETRLLKIIQDGKGQIKDLLLAEKELGVWRTKIEELEGELRYYANQVSLSTLAVSLVEKEIRAAATVRESERVNAGIEVEDVEKAMRDALKAVAAAKGRVTRSELKQHGAGQFNAILNFSVPPDDAGPVRDLLRQLGHMVRLEIDRVQTMQNGTKPLRDGKLQRGDTQFIISMYNLANISPRERVTLKLAAEDVAAAYQTLRAAVAKVKGRVTSTNFNDRDRRNITATVDFDIPRLQEGSILKTLKETGLELSRFITRAPEGDNVTDAKVAFAVELINAATLAARETVTLNLAAQDVGATYKALRDKIAKAKGRITNDQFNEQDLKNTTARLQFDLPRTEEAALLAILKDKAQELSRVVSRLPENTIATDSKVAYVIDLVNADNITPRKNVVLALEVDNVDSVVKVIAAFAREINGKNIDSQKSQDLSGQAVSRVIYDVPLDSLAALIDKIEPLGKVRVNRETENQGAPKGKLALGRIEVTISNALLLPRDKDLWSEIRSGLSISLRGLALSASWLIVAVLVVLPWVLLIYGLFLVGRRIWRGREFTPVTVAASAGGGAETNPSESKGGESP